MKTLVIILGIFVLVALLFLLITYICYLLAFYVSDKTKEKDASDTYALPKGKIYEPFKDQMIEGMKKMRSIPHKDIYIESFDGLKLHGQYYEYTPGATIELMFHGYRGSAERDLCIGIQRCFALKRNVLIVDQRASCRSEGNTITFGINESRDCLSWINYITTHLGSDIKIILTGISMGASTVMIAAGMDLPKNVVGALADCGYTSAKEIIKKVLKDIKLPPAIMYPIIKLAAKMWGHFDLEEFSPIESMKNCKIPMIFIHGETDDFVPCEMSVRCYNACTTPKALLTVPGAGHGLSYMLDMEGYIRTLDEFDKKYHGI